MALETGHYAPVTAKKVTHWPAPDKDGDGAEVWEDQYDGVGNLIGRKRVKDAEGNEIFEYEAPEGFRNLPSKEAGADGVTDNYVKVDARGRVARHPRTGEAMGIKPGTTLIEHPDGNFELLQDDFSRYLFEKGHEKVDEPSTADVKPPQSDEERKKAEDEKDREEFEAWKAQRDTQAPYEVAGGPTPPPALTDDDDEDKSEEESAPVPKRRRAKGDSA